MGWYTVPKPVSVVGTQTTSRKSETRLSAVVITFPYLTWKGSSIVIQFLSLIGLTNTKPPIFYKRTEHITIKIKRSREERKNHIQQQVEFFLFFTTFLPDVKSTHMYKGAVLAPWQIMTGAKGKRGIKSDKVSVWRRAEWRDGLVKHRTYPGDRGLCLMWNHKLSVIMFTWTCTCWSAYL